VLSPTLEIRLDEDGGFVPSAKGEGGWSDGRSRML